MLLRSAPGEARAARYSFVAADPFLTFRAWGTRCEWETGGGQYQQFGDPWRLLDLLLARYELPDEPDCPFPCGGAFGFWGYDLRLFVEPRLGRTAVRDLDLPDCHLGFYDSLVVFDSDRGTASVVSTGLQPDGSRDLRRARDRAERWLDLLATAPGPPPADRPAHQPEAASVGSTTGRARFLRMVEAAQRYIRAGHIYQVNLSHPLSMDSGMDGWWLFRRLSGISPAPFAAWLDGGDFALVSSSPELFLRMSGRHVVTRPIKGTRPRSNDPTRDAQLAFELQTSPKEIAELVMITDLLRNDLGRVAEFGSVHVPDLARLERFAHVQHLVSTVEGRLRPDLTHAQALRACFPGGSITGAPKVRAMEIIDELEPQARGPYTGCLGYLGFNRESLLSIIIRTAVCLRDRTCFHVGAGIVADSVPEAEWEETLAKGRGFLEALGIPAEPVALDEASGAPGVRTGGSTKDGPR